MSWIFNDGKFYVNEAGNSIYYIEQNPCGCCQNSFLVYRKTPIHKKINSFTRYPESLDKFIKIYKLIELN